MSFMNIEKAAKKYVSEPMKGNVERLKDFDIFHCLLSGSVEKSFELQKKYNCFPLEFLDWLKFCDGGLLFDTVMLTTNKHDDDLDLDFDTYDDMNSEEAYSDFKLPEGYVVFAMRSYGDPICFKKDKKDKKVYLWDVEKEDFTDIWYSFQDWLTEEIDDGVRLIADGVLEPLNIKDSGEDDE